MPRKKPPVPQRQPTEPKNCRICNGVFERGKNERLDNFHVRETCGPKCAAIWRKERAAGIPRQPRKPDPPPKINRFRITDEEEAIMGASALRLFVKADGGFPSDGSRAFSEPVIYKPGDPGFAVIAATVTPIERIPGSHCTFRVWG